MEEIYSLSIENSLKMLSSSRNGLSGAQINALENPQKTNEIASGKKTSLFVKFLKQFQDLMILILLIASFISIFIGIWQHQMGEIIDGGIILFIVFMNAIFGLVQENKAEKSLEALKKFTEPECLVIRDGVEQKIFTKRLVKGDIVILESGSIVPADIRLIESISLQIDESSLTGESSPCEKDATALIKKGAPLADRKNMAYKGCVVTSGRGVGVVYAIGGDTEIGQIASSISSSQKSLTPLEKNIKEVGKLLTYLVLGVAFVTFFLEVVARPGNVLEAFLTAVAISVAAIPESMPAIITIIMSMGLSRLAKQKAIVKSLRSVETLGCCDVICSDKTGTITQNKMSVADVYILGQNYAKNSDFSSKMLLSCMCLCNNSLVKGKKLLGNASEIALTNYAQSKGYSKLELCEKYRRIKENPFSSQRKIMSTINNFEGKKVMFVKGAVDVVLQKCDRVLIGDQVVGKNENYVAQIQKINSNFADKALRVLAFAYKECENNDENNLVFIGLAGIYDPPRKEIKNAVKKCKRAGMRAVMITGDHKDTAFAVAKECEIASEQNQVLTGQELDRLSDEELDKILPQICVYARVSPKHKVRIIEAFNRNGHITAMTGDGVNDAPSLKKASIGIGMGITGTDVTKEVADVIVTDDNFATIVIAVEEGRKIYQNIVKAVKFLFSANMGELMSLFLATVLFPNFVFLFPVQILFVNLITDSLPAIALGLETPESDLMSLKPRSSKKGLFADGCGIMIGVLGAVQTILTLIAFYIGLCYGGQASGVSMAFYTLNIIQMFYLASMRTNGSMFKSNPFKNKMFIVALAFSFGLLGLIALTPLHTYLSLAPLPAELWLVIFALCLVMMLTSELYKICYKVCSKNKKNNKKITQKA